MIVNEEYEGKVEDHSFNYFHFEVQSQTNINVQLTPQNGTTDCIILIQSSSFPTSSFYQYIALSSSSPSNLIVMNPLGYVWYIGISTSHSCFYSLSFSYDNRLFFFFLFFN